MTQYSHNIVSEWLEAMQQRLQAIVTEDDSVAMIGIRTGGVDVARHLHSALNISEPLGELNISFYRDDFSTVGLHPVVGPSQVPINVEGRHIILVDDVLSTGRTVRAAMNEIFDYGRPSRITLAVLVQRTGHELPIRADIIGHSIDVPENEHVSLDAQHMTISVGQRK
jgi:pyrimidine operon attenuation protein/uracil phosphoribosyltransferase